MDQIYKMVKDGITALQSEIELGNKRKLEFEKQIAEKEERLAQLKTQLASFMEMADIQDVDNIPDIVQDPNDTI